MALRNMTRSRRDTTVWLHHMWRLPVMRKWWTLVSLMRIRIMWRLGRWSRTLCWWSTGSLRRRRHRAIHRRRGCHFVSLCICICQQKKITSNILYFSAFNMSLHDQNTFKLFLCTYLIGRRYSFTGLIILSLENSFFYFTILPTRQIEKPF